GFDKLSLSGIEIRSLNSAQASLSKPPRLSRSPPITAPAITVARVVIASRSSRYTLVQYERE
ncbi:hypothetical protein, partial [Novosphingobium sp. 11B]